MFTKSISNGLFIAGLIGLIISILGETTTLGNYKSSGPRSWEKFDTKLVNKTPDFLSLQKETRLLTNHTTSEQQKMLILYDKVAQRFTHTEIAQYNIFSNWFLWLLGHLYPSFSYIGKPEILLQYGHSALCSQQTYILQVLAGYAGIHNRKVDLSGHVVMEAWYDNDWHLFDPDMEVVPLIESNEILSLDELANSPALLKRFYLSSEQQKVISIISSRKDNSFSKAHPKPTISLYVENIASYLKWIVPTLFVLTAIYLRKQK